MSLRPEVWVWLSRTQAGRLHGALPDALYEAGALARRLAVPLVGVGDLVPTSEERAELLLWQLAEIRVCSARLAPHPTIHAGRASLAGLYGVPRAFVLLADPFGTVTAPLFAAEHDAALVTGGTSVTTDGRHFVAACPTLGSQFEALVSMPLDDPLVVTLQPGAVGQSAWRAPDTMPTPLQATRILPPDAATLDVSDADRIVAFGRGAFSPQAIAWVERLAALLGATVAGTRPAADEGWLPFAKQVGLTGAIVSPRLYVAVGISGAPYHMVGVKDPETLIAVNSDPEAPIFASAHVGIVGDLHRVLPALIARLERGQELLPASAALHSDRVAARHSTASGTRQPKGSGAPR